MARMSSAADPAAHPCGRRQHPTLAGTALDVGHRDDVHVADGVQGDVVSDGQRGDAVGLVPCSLPAHRLFLKGR